MKSLKKPSPLQIDEKSEDFLNIRPLTNPKKPIFNRNLMNSPANSIRVIKDIEYVPFERVYYESQPVKKVEFVSIQRKIIDYLPIERKKLKFYSPMSQNRGFLGSRLYNQTPGIFLNRIHEKRPLFEDKIEISEPEMKDLERSIEHILHPEKELIENRNSDEILKDLLKESEEKHEENLDFEAKNEKITQDDQKEGKISDEIMNSNEERGLDAQIDEKVEMMIEKDQKNTDINNLLNHYLQKIRSSNESPEKPLEHKEVIEEKHFQKKISMENPLDLIISEQEIKPQSLFFPINTLRYSQGPFVPNRTSFPVKASNPMLMNIVNYSINRARFESGDAFPERPQTMISNASPFQRLQSIETINRDSIAATPIGNSLNFSFRMGNQFMPLQRLQSMESPIYNRISEVRKQEVNSNIQPDLAIVGEVRNADGSFGKLKKIEDSIKINQAQNRIMVPPIREGNMKNTFQMPNLRQTNNEYILEALKQQQEKANQSLNQGLGVNYFVSPYLAGYINKK